MSSLSDSGFDIIFDDEEISTSSDWIQNKNAMKCQVDDPLFGKFKQWARSSSTKTDAADKVKAGLVDNFRFYLLDCDSWTCRASNLEFFDKCEREDCKKEAEDSTERLESVIRLYGVGEDGKSVCCIVRGFLPHFYARTTKQLEDSEVQTLTDQLNSAILKKLENSESYANFVNSQNPAILKIEKLDSCCGILGLDSQRESGPLEGSLLKITSSLTMLVTEAATILISKGQESTFASYGFELHEADLKPAVRYMAAQGVPCCSWIEAKRAVLVSQQNEESRISYTDLILSCEYQNLRALSADEEPQEIPKLRVLSLDIEISDPVLLETRNAPFPKPGTKPVVQIGNVLRTHGDEGAAELQVIFALNSCDPIEDAQVLAFDSEEDLLMAWRLFVVLTDPDILTGYNLHHFDFAFLFERAKVLGLKDFPYFGKCVSTAMGYQAIPASHKRVNFKDYHGDHVAKISGRVVFDMISIVRCEYPQWKRNGGWRLDEASKRLINERKLGVMHWDIPKLQNTSSATRCQLAKYCLQDAMLAMKLMLNLPKEKSKCFFEKYSEKTREYGCLLRLVTCRSDAYLRSIKALRAVKNNGVC